MAVIKRNTMTQTTQVAQVAYVVFNVTQTEAGVEETKAVGICFNKEQAEKMVFDYWKACNTIRKKEWEIGGASSWYSKDQSDQYNLASKDGRWYSSEEDCQKADAIFEYHQTEEYKMLASVPRVTDWAEVPILAPTTSN